MRKNSWKRLRFFVIAAVFCLSSLSVTENASAEEISSETTAVAAYDSVYYTLDVLGNAIITGGNEDCETIEIPNVIDGHVVTKIAEEAFAGNETLQSVYIPDSVTSIGDHAFYNCFNLVEVEGAASAIYVGQEILEGTQWQASCETDLAVLSGRIAVDVIYENASVVIPDGVEVLADCLFLENETVVQVEMPKSVLYVGNSCFACCTALADVHLSSGLRQIRDSAFYECTALELAEFPNTLISIGNQAFYGCTAIDSISFSNGLRTIGDSAFESCTALRLLVLPLSLTSIGNSAFSNCTALYMLVISGKLEKIPTGAFSGCKMLEYAAIADTVKSIGDYAFSDCTSLRIVNMPENLREIGSYAFSMCTSLTDLELPASVHTVGKDAFSKTGWMEQQEGAWVLCDGVLLEYRGDAEMILIPQGVHAISSGFLANQSNVVRVVLPSGMTSVSADAFLGCETVRQVDFSGTITNIENGAFQYCTSLQTITGMSAVEIIGDSAFQGCTALREITLPAGLVTMGTEAFRDCSSLENVQLPATLTIMGDRAFYGCSSLMEGQDSFQMRNTRLAEIGSEVFAYCSNLKTLVLPETVVSIQADSFTGCDDMIIAFLRSDTEIPMQEETFPVSAHLRGLEGSTIQQYAQTFERQFELLNDGAEESTTEPLQTTSAAMTTQTTSTETSAISVTMTSVHITLPPFITADTVATTTVTTEQTGFGTELTITSTEYVSDTCETMEMTGITTSESTAGSTDDWTGATMPSTTTSGVWDTTAASAYSTTTMQHETTPPATTTVTETTFSTTETSVTSNTNTSGEISQGDVNGDGKVDMEDAYQTLLIYTRLSVGETIIIDDEILFRMDVDSDGVVSINDAYQILWFYAKRSVDSSMQVSEWLKQIQNDMIE